MTIDREHVEEALEARIAAKYRREGYKVVANPQASDLPFDLGIYQPDLLVVKESKGGHSRGYIVEIKKSAAQTSIDRYMEIADQVSEYPGWRFVLITGDDVRAADEPESEVDLLSWDQMDRLQTQAEKLLAAGESESAFMSLWIMLEAILRRRAEETFIPVEGFPTASLIRQLYSHGELSIDQYDRTMALQIVRNRVAHGFHKSDVGRDAEQLRGLVQELSAQWRPR